jgi:hypothetical protein
LIAVIGRQLVVRRSQQTIDEQHDSIPAAVHTLPCRECETRYGFQQSSSIANIAEGRNIDGSPKKGSGDPR